MSKEFALLQLDEYEVSSIIYAIELLEIAPIIGIDEDRLKTCSDIKAVLKQAKCSSK